MMNTELALEPQHYEETNWLLDPIQYGTLAIMPPNVMTMFGSSLTEPIGRIHWAGTETALHFNGYMVKVTTKQNHFSPKQDGAISSGKRAATQILNSILDKAN